MKTDTDTDLQSSIKSESTQRAASRGTSNERGATRVARTVPDLQKAMFLRVYSGTASLRQAIKAKCIECCGFENYFERVGQCTAYSCPLWGYRPYQSRESDDTSENESVIDGASA